MKLNKEPIVTSRSITTIVAPAVAVIVAASSLEAQQAAAPKPDSSGYVAANGVNYWFEIHGKGEPLLLLHGGLFSTGLFGPTLTKLAESRRVIGVDLHGHGHTALGTRPKISLVDIGRDLAVVVQKLGLRQVDVMGYSFGGGAAMQLAFQHPELVRRLVIVSAPYAQNGFFAEMLPQQAAVSAAMADQMKDTPMYKTYAAIAPQPAGIPATARRDGRIHAPAVRLVGEREAAHDAGDARVRRRRHDPPRAHRLVLPAARRRAEGRRLDARAHVEEPARDSAGPDALRDRHRADPGAPPFCRSSTGRPG